MSYDPPFFTFFSATAGERLIFERRRAKATSTPLKVKINITEANDTGYSHGESTTDRTRIFFLRVMQITDLFAI
jgi:hypothetical protein